MLNKSSDYKALQMLLILESFKEKKNEVRGIQKLFFLTAIMNFPTKLNKKLASIGENEIELLDYYKNNIELEALKQKEFLNLDDYYPAFGRLVGKGLIDLGIERGDKIVRINQSGIDLLNKLDDYSLYETRGLSKIVKQRFGNLSFSQLKSEFEGIIKSKFAGESKYEGAEN